MSNPVRVLNDVVSAGPDVIMRAAEGWYGYGNWNAPYWFVGPEPGMKKAEGDNLLARCQAWQDLGAAELLDCLAHHKAFGHTRYHDRTIRMKQSVGSNSTRPPLQDTWRQLIRTLLAFRNDRCDNDAVGDYQAEAWGASDGESCVAELSALAARGLSTPRDRMAFRDARAAHLRQRVLEHRPRFVLMYGGGKNCRPSWDRIAGGVGHQNPFEERTIHGWPTGIAVEDGIVFVRAAHPVNAGGAAPPTEYWLAISEVLRTALT